MEYKEEHRDLFSVNFKKYTPAHCISSDCAMGAGIAVPIRKKFKLGGLRKFPENVRKYPTCIYHNKVYNLITKDKYWHKPTYQSLEAALNLMKVDAIVNDVKHIVMPKIGSGLDRLSWPLVRKTIQAIFEDTDIEILVCYI
jgi:hypothetical protein